MKLSEIQEAVEKKYISLPIEFANAAGEEKVLDLRNFLRMQEDEQMKVDAIIKQFKDIDDLTNARGVFTDFLILLSGNEALVREFLTTINNDMSIMMFIVEKYTEVTQAEKA